MPTANKPQCEFLALPHKFKAFVAGYGSGKTFVGCMDQCVFALGNPKVTQGYFAPTYPQIRDIYYPTIEEVAYSFGLDVDIKESNKEVHIMHGRKRYSTIICRSMERPGTIIGFKIGNALIDEIDTLLAEKATEAFRKILARLRYKGAKNGASITTTPEGFGFTHKHFVELLNTKPELRGAYGLIQASTYDNEINLPDDYIQSLIDTYPKELIDAYINGQFVNLTSGTVYYAFNRKLHNSLEAIKEGEPLHIGMDFNVGKMSAKVFVIRGESWHCVAELVDVFDTPAIIDIIKEKWPKHVITVYPDSSGKSKKSVDASKSDIALLEQAGFRLRYNPSNPLVKDRVMSVNKQFQIGNLYVSLANCPYSVKDLEQQTYDKNGEPDKSNGNDHGNDSFGYPIAYKFPITKPIISSPIRYVS